MIRADRHYVYMYWDLQGVPRYVGIGGTPGRWKSHLTKSDNIWLRRMISDLKKRGLQPTYCKVSEGLTREEAGAEEIRLIALYGREGLDREGTLYNRTIGGDLGGGISRPQSDRERLDRAKKMQAYWDSPEGFARKQKQSELSRVQMSTPEAKARTAALGTSRKGCVGKPQTDEWKAMIGSVVAESNRRRICKDETRQKRSANMKRIRAERKSA